VQGITLPNTRFRHTTPALALRLPECTICSAAQMCRSSNSVRRGMNETSLFNWKNVLSAHDKRDKPRRHSTPQCEQQTNDGSGQHKM
jgi:hypothetical protein